jgi:hypothetical protein
MLTNNYKCLYTNSNRWLLGNCKKGVVINELANMQEEGRRNIMQYKGNIISIEIKILIMKKNIFLIIPVAFITILSAQQTEIFTDTQLV